MSAGFAIGTVGMRVLPWPVPGNVLVAVIVGLALGVVEILAIRRFSSGRAKQLLLLDGAPFPFASVGVAAAVIVFGAH